VNDYAQLLSPDARQRLEQSLAAHEQATNGAQMVVAIFPSLEGESIEDFGIRLAERWRIGQKGIDNGAILLVFVKERRARLEIGYGLEPVVPDAIASQIIREVMGPRFREGRYAEGIAAAADAVYARIEKPGSPVGAPGARPDVPPAPRHGSGISPFTLGMLAIFGVIGLLLAREAMSGARARGLGYTAGGRRGWNSPRVIVPPVFGGWGGGGSSSGGGGGGGFSAGGGGFGGGGASGDW
jgi:uncharacterized protein